MDRGASSPVPSDGNADVPTTTTTTTTTITPGLPNTHSFWAFIKSKEHPLKGEQMAETEATHSGPPWQENMVIDDERRVMAGLW